MKTLMQKLSCVRGSQWLLLLLAAALMLWTLTGKNTAATSSMTDDESRIAAVLSQIEGAGETRVVIFYQEEKGSFGGESKTPAGAVIVSRGAEDLSVRLKLLAAVQTLLGLSQNAVEVFSMEDAQ